MPFPSSVMEQAAQRRLGEPIRAFDTRGARRRALVRPALLALGVVAFAALAVAGFATGRPWPGALAALSAVVCLGGAVRTFRAHAELLGRTGVPGAVYLFVHGLAVDDGKALGIHRWDEVTAVTVSGVRAAPGARTRWRVTVTVAGERDLVLGDGTPDAGVLGEIVSAEVTARAVPRLMAAVESRERVRLGPFVLGPDGIEKDGDTLAWQALDEAGIDDGVVYARAADGVVQLTALAARVPNAVAFVEVCRRLQARYRDEGDRVH